MTDQRKQAVVDRIEEERFAVLLVSDDTELVVPVEDLPDGAEGGTWIQFEEQNGRLVNASLDEEKQAQMRASISEKMERLRKRESSHGDPD